jgi:hypothetical protein
MSTRGQSVGASGRGLSRQPLLTIHLLRAEAPFHWIYKIPILCNEYEKFCPTRPLDTSDAQPSLVGKLLLLSGQQLLLPGPWCH